MKKMLFLMLCFAHTTFPMVTTKNPFMANKGLSRTTTLAHATHLTKANQVNPYKIHPRNFQIFSQHFPKPITQPKEINTESCAENLTPSISHILTLIKAIKKSHEMATTQEQRITTSLAADNLNDRFSCNPYNDIATKIEPITKPFIFSYKRGDECHSECKKNIETAEDLAKKISACPRCYASAIQKMYKDIPLLKFEKFTRS